VYANAITTKTPSPDKTKTDPNIFDTLMSELNNVGAPKPEPNPVTTVNTNRYQSTTTTTIDESSRESTPKPEPTEESSTIKRSPKQQQPPQNGGGFIDPNYKWSSPMKPTIDQRALDENMNQLMMQGERLRARVSSPKSSLPPSGFSHSSTTLNTATKQGSDRPLNGILKSTNQQVPAPPVRTLSRFPTFSNVFSNNSPSPTKPVAPIVHTNAVDNDGDLSHVKFRSTNGVEQVVKQEVKEPTMNVGGAFPTMQKVGASSSESVNSQDARFLSQNNLKNSFIKKPPPPPPPRNKQEMLEQRQHELMMAKKQHQQTYCRYLSENDV